MNIDAHSAQIALADVNRAKARAGAFGSYARAWPSLLVWGLVWMAANIVQQFAPAFAALVWFAGIGVGIASSIAVGLQGGKEDPAARNARMRRFVASALIVAAAIAGVFNIMAIHDVATVDAVLSLVVAAAYAIAGIWSGSRFLWLGVALCAAILGGWIGLRDYFALWSGAVGGGAIVLTALWLRTA
jgi:hypothetical protein